MRSGLKLFLFCNLCLVNDHIQQNAGGRVHSLGLCTHTLSAAAVEEATEPPYNLSGLSSEWSSSVFFTSVEAAEFAPGQL